MLFTRSRLVLNKVTFLRLCHNFNDPFSLQSMQMIKTFDKTVDPYSKIYIETPMNVKITPIDLLKHPDGDRMILSLYSRAKETSTKFSIKQTPKRVDIVGKEALPDKDAVCVIQAPIRASFQIEASGKSCISVEHMHSDECHLKSTSGVIKIKDLRGQSIKIRSEEGPVVCEGTVLAEKIDIRTDANADITCQHIRSNDLKIATDGGNISTDSCYADESSFTTVLGSLKLGNLHRKCTVEILERGDLTMTGFDGTLKAILKRGNVHIQASKLYDKNSIFVHESGLVDVLLSNIVNEMTLIELIARKLKITEEISNLGALIDDPQHKKFRYEDDRLGLHPHELYVECRNGTVEMKMSSWKEMLQKKGIEFDKS